jgi:signal transduction histidine kinase
VTLRQKLLLMFSLTIVAIVAGFAWTVSMPVRRVFEEQNKEQTAALVNQFQKEFAQRAGDTSAAMDRMASSDSLKRIAFKLANGGDAASYLTTAASLAREYQLDDLELVDSNGNIISSAQWPARFGYHEPAVTMAGLPAFLKEEPLPDGSSEIGIFSVRTVLGAKPALYLVGGRVLDAKTLRDFAVPAGMRVFLYRNLGTEFDPASFAGATGGNGNASAYRQLIDQAIRTGGKSGTVIFPSARREDSVDATAIPLKGQDGKVLAVLVVTTSRRGMVEVQNHIRAIAYGGAGVGILLAILASLWIAARVSGPIEQLARAAEEVAAGEWNTRVEVRGKDEVGVLGASFNHMTEQLAEQRERLVQSERVAAWRELARRLAHELKNPLFPLQITVENMVRARALPQDEFEEVFLESANTLQAEIENLKKIVGRFSDFSKMPRPQTESMDARDAVRRVAALYGPALDEKRIDLRTIVDNEALPICADPELLHRALSNLVLNAMDAMPDGGILTIAIARSGDVARLSVADSGEGLTPEECERLFTPYYTTKQHGTGLGLAIVQSVIADHHGTIAVERGESGGARFVMELPLAAKEPEE